MQTDINKINFWELPEIKEPIVIEFQTLYTKLYYDTGFDKERQQIVKIVYTYKFESAKGSRMHYINYRRTVIADGTTSYNAALQAVLSYFKNDSLVGIYVYDKLVSPELLNQNF